MSSTKEIKENITKRIKEAYIQSLKNGTTRAEACKAAKVDVSSIWQWIKDDQEFAKAVEIALESRIEVAVDSLFENVKKGNIIAQIFWTKNRGRGKWKDKQEVEFVMPKVIKVLHFVQSGKPPVIVEEPEIEEKKEENQER